MPSSDRTDRRRGRCRRGRGYRSGNWADRVLVRLLHIVAMNEFLLCSVDCAGPACWLVIIRRLIPQDEEDADSLYDKE